jgi:hypothetical protein
VATNQSKDTFVVINQERNNMDTPKEFNRRQFLLGAGAAAAGTTARLILPSSALIVPQLAEAATFNVIRGSASLLFFYKTFGTDQYLFRTWVYSTGKRVTFVTDTSDPTKLVHVTIREKNSSGIWYLYRYNSGTLTASSDVTKSKLTLPVTNKHGVKQSEVYTDVNGDGSDDTGVIALYPLSIPTSDQFGRFDSAADWGIEFLTFVSYSQVIGGDRDSVVSGYLKDPDLTDGKIRWWRFTYRDDNWFTFQSLLSDCRLEYINYKGVATSAEAGIGVGTAVYLGVSAALYLFPPGELALQTFFWGCATAGVTVTYADSTAWKNKCDAREKLEKSMAAMRAFVRRTGVAEYK